MKHENGIASLATRCKGAGCKTRVLKAMTEDGRTLLLDPAVPVYLVYRLDNGAMRAERAHDCYPVHVHEQAKEKRAMKRVVAMLMLFVTSALASTRAIVDPWPDPVSWPCYIMARPPGSQGRNEAKSCTDVQYCSMWAREMCLDGQAYMIFGEYDPINGLPAVCLIQCYRGANGSTFGMSRGTNQR